MEDLITQICSAYVRNGTDHPDMKKLLNELVHMTQPGDFRETVKFSKAERGDNARALKEEAEAASKEG